ncbi:MAG TPA: GxxExxY protein [Edaphobacter sp.]|nr:GxxExxY protein [Edaphobacter sp.]
MNTDEELKTDGRRFGGLHSEITDKILSVFFDVYNELGGGFLESVYQQALKIALAQVGLKVVVEMPIPVYFRGEVVGNFRADCVVNDCVLLELKAISAFDRAHESQILHYLRATAMEVGLLLNFGPRPQFKRFILENDKKKSVPIRVNPRSMD